MAPILKNAELDIPPKDYNRRVRSLLALMVCNGFIQHAHTEEVIFTPADIIQWHPHSFTGETLYTLVEIDGRQAVHADCKHGTASGLFMKHSIDLTKTPIIEWEWRVKQTFRNIDETTQAGDDYPARLYAVDAYTFARWHTRVLNYVWASEMPAGTNWENAYQSRAQMIAVQSGSPEASGQWQTQRRNLREDFSHFHDRELDHIDTVAIMTDCDNTRQAIEAWYGTIRLLPQ